MELWSEEFYKTVDPQVLVVGQDFALPRQQGFYNPVQRTCFDIIYVVGGCGRYMVDDTWRQHQPGEVIFIKPGYQLQAEIADQHEPYREYFMHIHPFGREDHPAVGLFTEVCPVSLIVQDRQLPTHFANLFKIYMTKPTNYHLKLKYTVLQILDILFDNIRYRPDGDKGNIYMKLQKAKAFIEQHYTEELTVDQIAEYVDISSSYLMFNFKKFYNFSPISYKILQQLNNAKLLLAQNMSVSEAAYKTGFKSMHYFSRIFKDKVGMSPSRFVDLSRRK